MKILSKFGLFLSAIAIFSFANMGIANACANGRCNHNHHEKHKVKHKAKKKVKRKIARAVHHTAVKGAPKPAATTVIIHTPTDPLALPTCHANELQHLIGQNRSVLQTMRFGQQVRFEEPGMSYTADYIETRLRIQIGEDGKIKRVLCG